MKVALVHDWLTGMRGGEKVLEVFCRIFPQADLHTLLHLRGRMSPVIEGMRIHTSFIDRLPVVQAHYRSYLPLFPLAIGRFDLRGYDLIVSSSHCVAKGARRAAGGRHLCYCLTPMRYVWDMYGQYFGRGGGTLPVRTMMRIARPALRRWDVASASRVDRFVAISRNVAERIWRHYGRKADVIYPPVDCERFTPGGPREDFYLVVSAFAPYKRIDLAVAAFNELKRPLKIVGGGQDEHRLAAMAGPNVEFLGPRSDDEIVELYRRCRALIFPGEEDFGITPLEAMACGRPVIAYGRGGVTETVVPFNPVEGMLESASDGSSVDGPPAVGETPTGLFFYEQTPAALSRAVEWFERHGDRFDPIALRGRARRFDLPRFEARIRKYIDAFMEKTSGVEEA